jgi:hypothetical protein
MELLQEFGWAILGLAIFVGLAAIDQYRRKNWQKNRKEETP